MTTVIRWLLRFVLVIFLAWLGASKQNAGNMMLNRLLKFTTGIDLMYRKNTVYDPAIHQSIGLTSPSQVLIGVSIYFLLSVYLSTCPSTYLPSHLYLSTNKCWSAPSTAVIVPKSRVLLCLGKTTLDSQTAGRGLYGNELSRRASSQ